MKRRVAILISGRGSNMSALIAAARAPDYPAEIAVVISNKADAEGVALAREAGCGVAIVESKPFGKDRAAFEATLQAVLEQHTVDLICLAGFMRLFTAGFVQRWQARMLNIHPSLLPPRHPPARDRCRRHGSRLHGPLGERRRRRRRDHCAGQRADPAWRYRRDTGGADPAGRTSPLSAGARDGMP
jgi:folate-dependent phosphoribosylglycinamide formyltransferase PurN